VALGGLAQRLVQDGLLDENAMQDAIAKAKEKRASSGHPPGVDESSHRARYRHFRLE